MAGSIAHPGLQALAMVASGHTGSSTSHTPTQSGPDQSFIFGHTAQQLQSSTDTSQTSGPFDFGSSMPLDAPEMKPNIGGEREFVDLSTTSRNPRIPTTSLRIPASMLTHSELDRVRLESGLPPDLSEPLSNAERIRKFVDEPRELKRREGLNSAETEEFIRKELEKLDEEDKKAACVLHDAEELKNKIEANRQSFIQALAELMKNGDLTSEQFAEWAENYTSAKPRLRAEMESNLVRKMQTQSLRCVC